MTNDNDSFIREVNEQLRSEQLQSVWSRYGALIVGLAVSVVFVAAAIGIYEYWSKGRSSDSGDQFANALTLAAENKPDEALKALNALESAGHGAYPVLAKFRAATLLAQKGDGSGAVAAFTALGKDNSVPPVFRDAARVRAAFLLVDAGSYEQVSAEAEVLAAEGQALRNSAREALGLAAYKAGDLARARQWFEAITADGQAPRNAAARARILLDNIASSGKAP